MRPSFALERACTFGSTKSHARVAVAATWLRRAVREASRGIRRDPAAIERDLLALAEALVSKGLWILS